jgi:hypothetical protein
MSGQHTPGPWVAKTGTANTSVYSGAFAVAVGCKESDARLIAAAPALLEALEHAYGMHLSVCPACECEQFRPARAAIAAAKGENNA